MQCPRCGRPVGGGAAFCPNCGTFLAAPAVPGGPAMAVPVQRNNNTLWAILGTVLVLVVILFGLKAAGVLQFGSKNGDSRSLVAQSGTDSDGLKMRGSPDANTLNQGREAAPGMPDDVRRYLEHVQRIEKKKVDLTLQMVSQLEVFKTKLGTFEGAEGLMNHDEDLGGDGKRPDQETQTTFSDVKKQWEDLVTEFKSVDPPQQCVGLRDDYYRALSEIPGFAGDLTDVLNMVSSDPSGALQKVHSMQNTSSNAIDKYFGQSDDDVSQICNRYNTTKWFTIVKDVGGGSLTTGGMGGL